MVLIKSTRVHTQCTSPFRKMPLRSVVLTLCCVDYSPTTVDRASEVYWWAPAPAIKLRSYELQCSAMLPTIRAPSASCVVYFDSTAAKCRTDSDQNSCVCSACVLRTFVCRWRGEFVASQRHNDTETFSFALSLSLSRETTLEKARPEGLLSHTKPLYSGREPNIDPTSVAMSG